MRASIARALIGDTLATALLLMTIVGSGVMADRLSAGNDGIALLCNTIATACMLIALISIFGPVSGAHLNPAISLAFAIQKRITWADAVRYVPCQLFGAIIGVWIAHVMFDLPIIQSSMKARFGLGQWLSEIVATFGLGLIVFGSLKTDERKTAALVGIYIAAAYWFTASTSFANPAVTIARSLTNTFSGIAPSGILPFLASQAFGMALAVAVSSYLWPKTESDL